METTRIRLRTRIYLAITGLFYTLVGIAFSNTHLRLSGSFHPHLFWSCAFIFGGILSFFGWTNGGYQMAQTSLYICTSIALGFSMLFLSRVLAGDPSFVLGTAVWAYMAFSHYTVARLPDPFLITYLEAEVEKLKSRMK